MLRSVCGFTHDPHLCYNPNLLKEHLMMRTSIGELIAYSSAPALALPNRKHPRRFPCPTCHVPNRLTVSDTRRRFQCDDCMEAGR